MEASASRLALRALATAAVVVSLIAPEDAAPYVPVLMPYANETLCNNELHEEGVVIEPSQYESSQRYFSCAVKFRDNVSPRNASSRWVIRVDRIYIPYHKLDMSGKPPTIELLDQSSKSEVLFSFLYPTNVSSVKKDMTARVLSINFVNIPKTSDYKFVVTLDTGDVNCTEGHKCTKSHYCISTSLRCNNVDNCGDASDESEELCPQPPPITTIAVIGSFSAVLIVLIAVVIVAVYFCRTKITKRKRQVLRGVTVIRTPKQASPPRVIPASAANSLQRPRGPGFQPAPLALRNSMGSNGSLPRLVQLKQSQQGISSLAATPTDGSSRPIARASSDQCVPLLADEVARKLGPVDVTRTSVRTASLPRDEPAPGTSSQLPPKP